MESRGGGDGHGRVERKLIVEDEIVCGRSGREKNENAIGRRVAAVVESTDLAALGPVCEGVIAKNEDVEHGGALSRGEMPFDINTGRAGRDSEAIRGVFVGVDGEVRVGDGLGVCGLRGRECEEAGETSRTKRPNSDREQQDENERSAEPGRICAAGLREVGAAFRARKCVIGESDSAARTVHGWPRFNFRGCDFAEQGRRRELC